MHVLKDAQAKAKAMATLSLCRACYLSYNQVHKVGTRTLPLRESAFAPFAPQSRFPTRRNNKVP